MSETETKCNASSRNVVIILNDQGGGVMNVSYDVTSTLRAQDHGHPPLVYDARGNGGGCRVSNNHRRSSGQNNGLHRYCYTENHYGDYRATEQSNSIRAAGATLGGGSEVLVLCGEESTETLRGQSTGTTTLAAEVGGA